MVADDHHMSRQSFCAYLEASCHNLKIIGQAANGIELIDLLKKQAPDIVILDIGMPSLNGLEAARQILKEAPQTKVLILTVHDSEQVVREVLDAGARGFVLKSDAARDLVAAVDALRKNKTFFTSKVAEMVLDGFLVKGHTPLRGALGKGRLTPREREVVQLLAEGKTTKEVAAVLGLGFKTADTHRTNIMRKLGLGSLSELVLYAVRNGIVQVPTSLDAEECVVDCA